ncbi:amidohydrolase family protein [Thalassotalea ganghwensis]
MSKNKLFKSSLVALALATSFAGWAKSVAITNATIYTASEQGVLTQATVVFDNGKITAINPDQITADEIIDGQGKIVTPGFIGTVNQLGLVEVGAVSRTRDASEKKADITFDPSLAFNPKSTLIPYTRKGGITKNLTVPGGGDDMFKGQAFVADLSGDFDSVVKESAAIVIDLGAKSKGSRAHELQQLFEKFEDAQKKLAKAKEKSTDKDDKKADDPKRDEKLINALLSGEKPLLAYAQRATDLLALIKLKQTFGIDVVISGAADAVLVAEELAKAEIPVLINAVGNLPSSFDSLHNSLENASKLKAAGVKLILSVSGDTHNLYQLRFNAGIAVANGLDKDSAIAAITANVAEVFGLNAGQIVAGKDADIVLWSDDPFELSSKVEKLWISGEETSTQSRQDKLRERYMAQSTLPRAYIK